MKATKTRFNKLTAWVLTLAMIMTFIPSFTLGVSAEDTSDATTKNIMLGTNYITGGQQSNIYFGTYQQSSLGNDEPATGTDGVDWIKSDTATQNGQGAYYNIEPIKWRVLSNEDDKAFLLSDKNLDVVRYHEDYEAVTWETSTIRSWLNGYGEDANQNSKDYSSDNFINSAFSEKEELNVAYTELVNDDNPDYQTDGGNNTTDKIFLLSIEEARNSDYFADDSNRIATYTEYVANGGEIGTRDNGDGEVGSWWLRSPGGYGPLATYVGYSGSMGIHGAYAIRWYDVRPAFNLYLNTILFTSAASGGKPTGFSAVEDYSGNDWKLTIEDSNRSFSVTDTAEKTVFGGETLSIGYSNAVTGTNEYISAILVNSDDEVVYYGQLANVETESGTATLTVPSDIELGTYTLKLFNEQINGDYKTDYASAFENITLNIAEMCTITFNANGGTGEMANVAAASGEYTLPECTFTAPDGKQFAGWATSADGEVIIDETIQVSNNVTLYAMWEQIPKITEISFNTESSAYNSGTNTFTVAKDKAFEVYLKGSNFELIDDDFYKNTYFGFVPDVENSENALAASLAEFKEEGFTVAVETDTDTITLSFDYDAVKDFLGSSNKFEGICYGDGNSIKEGNIKSVNIVLKKYSSGGGGSSNTTTTTTKNDDGSTTKTTTNKSTGTTTETTTYPDGTTTTVETKKDGTVTTTEKDADGNTTTTVEKSDGTTVTTEKTADGTTTVTTENADGTATEVVTQKDGTKVITETTADGETTIEIDVPSDKETEVTVPVENAENVTSVVVTDKDGNETEITDFEITEDGIKISVSGDCTVAFGFAEKKIFDDVHPVNHWATNDIDYTYINSLMKGTSENLFSPDMPLTRAMLVTVLYRLEGEPRVSGITSFSDLEPGQYYLDAVCWAQLNGIVYGISDTEFAPNRNITREQIAAIMFRYAKYKEIAPTGAWAIRLTYTDLAEISDYAAEGVMYCKLKGIMQGKGENLFAPKDNATRAEIAAILHRFIETN